MESLSNEHNRYIVDGIIQKLRNECGGEVFNNNTLKLFDLIIDESKKNSKDYSVIIYTSQSNDKSDNYDLLMISIYLKNYFKVNENNNHHYITFHIGYIDKEHDITYLYRFNESTTNFIHAYMSSFYSGLQVNSLELDENIVLFLKKIKWIENIIFLNWNCIMGHLIDQVLINEVSKNYHKAHYDIKNYYITKDDFNTFLIFSLNKFIYNVYDFGLLFNVTNAGYLALSDYRETLLRSLSTMDEIDNINDQINNNGK